MPAFSLYISQADLLDATSTTSTLLKEKKLHVSDNQSNSDKGFKEDLHNTFTRRIILCETKAMPIVGLISGCIKQPTVQFFRNLTIKNFLRKEKRRAENKRK